jgi:hypothetical protein
MYAFKVSLRSLVALSTLFLAISALAQPNLTPYQPAAWSDKIVVSTVMGTTTDSSPLTTSDTLYVDWAVANFGATAANNYFTALYVDGVLQNTWTTTTLSASSYNHVPDYSIGSLSIGSHTLTLTADVNNTVAESNESDNTYTKTITVAASSLPNLTPYQPAGWSDKIVVSTGTGTSTDSAQLITTDTLYVDWAVINSGNSTANNFSTSLYVDGVLKTSWATASLGAGIYTSNQDYSIGALSAGSHTIKITADSGGAIAETSEADNSYSKVITVAAATASAPTLGNPADGSTGQSTTPAFSWSAVSGVTGYRIIVATSAADLPTDPAASAGGASVLLNATPTSTTYTPTIPLNPGTTYYWTVHGRTGGDNGTWSSVSSFTTGVPPSGLTIIPNFDSTITSDPQAAAIEATINSAIAVYQANFSDPVTVNITFHKMSSGLGQSSGVYYQPRSYSSYRAALVTHGTTADDTTALASLPNTGSNPVTGDPNVNIKLALGRALGFSANPPVGQPDGTVNLNIAIMNVSGASTDPSKYSLFGTVSHEIDEVLGFSSALNGSANGAPAPTGAVFPEDLFRYDAAGARSFTTDANAASYFSLDGITDLARYNQTQSGDYQDWYSFFGGVTPQVQDAFSPPNTSPVLGVELRVLDAIGYTRVLPQASITASAGANGSVTPNGTFNKSIGASQLFTGTPNAGYTVNQWLLDAAVVQTGGSNYTLANIQTNHTVQVTFTPKTNQAITFGTLANKNYGDAPISLSATASSGLAVTFSIFSGPATLAGNNLTITGAGTVVVRASQAGNTNYNAAPNVDQSFTVAKANQAITFGALGNKNYGDASFPVSATAGSGLAVTFSIFSGPATLAGNNLTITGAGTVVVRASQAGNANYNAAPNVDQSFTVAPAGQTITFGALANKNYGDAPFSVSATAGSGLAVSFSIFSGPATLAGNNLTITGAGTVVVRASQAGNANYNAAPNVDQSFTVAPAGQTITFGALGNKNYGDASFPVSATAGSGLAVSFSIFSGPATLAGNNLTITGAGTVVVRASQAGNTNYNAAPNVDQSFTVAKANQTITFVSLPNKALGEPAFAVIATASSGLPVNFSILSGPATISAGTVTLTNTGTVVVRASQAGNADYNVASNVDQSLTVYAPPSLSLVSSGQNVVISWTTNVTGFTLLSATDLAPVASWIPVVPSPVIVNGQYVVTNAASGPVQFYQLKK